MRDGETAFKPSLTPENSSVFDITQLPFYINHISVIIFGQNQLLRKRRRSEAGGRQVSGCGLGHFRLAQKVKTDLFILCRGLSSRWGQLFTFCSVAHV